MRRSALNLALNPPDAKAREAHVLVRAASENERPRQAIVPREQVLDRAASQQLVNCANALLQLPLRDLCRRRESTIAEIWTR